MWAICSEKALFYMDSKVYVKIFGLIVIIKETFDRVSIIKKFTEECARCTVFWA